MCRYITRPPIATKRLSLTRHGKLCSELKTPYSDGTTHLIFEPLDFISRLASLVSKRRVNLTHFYGVFAPNSKYRMQVPDIYQCRLWVESSYTPLPEAKFRFTPQSSYSPSLNFSNTYSSKRPEAAIHRVDIYPTPRAPVGREAACQSVKFSLAERLHGRRQHNDGQSKL